MTRAFSKGRSLSTNKNSTKSAKNINLNIELVREFTAFMQENDLMELDIRSGETEIRLKRRSNSVQESFSSGVMSPMMMNPEILRSSKIQNYPSVTDVKVEAKSNYRTICSPFVGTFYTTPAPNQPNFVEVGQEVKNGQTLGIVEAMKLMNEIESDMAGRIVSVLVATGTPVEFGEPLFEIEPLKK